ncbi:hypothetical protein [Rhizobium laguerreae]|uniref:hypothetical protein n=1 Tax=Rhizobium laguerreae TaxID=1076926 RepID=UPI00143F20BC|nr:hypothetical protein [Rhizobium laguerreae]
MEHRRTDFWKDPEHRAGSLEPFKDLIGRCRGGASLHLCSLASNDVFEKFAVGLRGAAVPKPGISGHDPGNSSRQHFGAEQPNADVHRRLTRADNCVALEHVIGEECEVREGILAQ